MRRVRSLPLVTVAALLAAVMVAPLAVANRYTEVDPAGDMAVALPGANEPAPNHRRLDIRRVFVRHTENVVKIRIVMRALTRPRDDGFHLGGHLEVNRQAQPSPSLAWQWDVYFDKDHPRHGSNMWVVDSGYQEIFGCDGRDQGLDATAHYNGNWVTVIIPRRCLTRRDDFVDPDAYTPVLPRWVRASVETEHAPGNNRPRYFDLSALTPRLCPG
jgi:hypothetical protein